jgi:hypothetical protein
MVANFPSSIFPGRLINRYQGNSCQADAVRHNFNVVFVKTRLRNAHMRCTATADVDKPGETFGSSSVNGTFKGRWWFETAVHAPLHFRDVALSTTAKA